MDQRTESRLAAIEQTLDEIVQRLEKIEALIEEEFREQEEEEP